jgi:hypothetical protein
MNIFEPKRVIYTAQSRHLFYAKMLICKFVLEQDAVPLNPFNMWGYFLYELVDRDLVRRGNNNVVRITDETWVFGPIADGVLAEIEYTMELKKPLKFFSAGSKLTDIKPINVEELIFEPEALGRRSEDELKGWLSNYLACRNLPAPVIDHGT